MARPLSDLLRKNAKFKLGDLERIAFEQLRGSLIGASVLRLFNPSAVTEIHTDASMHGYGAVLLQRDDEDQQLHPVEYMSRKTTMAEQKYHSYELEVLAVVQALKKWRIFVLGLRVKIVTDCNAFALTMRKQDVPPRVSRWALFLQEFDYSVEHRSGSRMKHVDALSRVSCLMVEDSLRYRIGKAQLQDDWIRAVRQVLEIASYEDFYIKFGLVYKDPIKELIVVPVQMEQEIIRIAHRQGHFSSRKTQDLVEKSFYIPNLQAKVEGVVRSCVECIVSDTKRGRKEGFLNPIDKADRPLITYHLDHVGPMENTHKQYNHILVIVDAFSKFMWLYPTKSTGSNEVVEKLTRQANVFGNPARIITDRGTAFTSNQFRQYCESENIEHLLIATGVPRGNGQVERMHRTIIPILTKLCAEKPANWYKYIDRVQRVMNSTPPRSTGITPFRLLTGLDMRIPDYPDIRGILEEFCIREFEEEREGIRKEARENILRMQQENKKSFDKKRVPETEYAPGELVAIKRTQFGTGMKLRPKFLGPYKITKKLDHGRYQVEKIGNCEGARFTTTVTEFMKKWEPHSGRM
ncbi:Transposon Tf2-9 polyprotein [Eumeta japonica]|uniref:RNA-directed DNA polymerase n=1 Tax=Eumeta variegata TaxID=151549 RepID=A0A4C1SNA2_EUMVA|nr:Transposon Tf2-9 polyprotein [Eumeta japonica]